ncbi:hypothetical protein PYW07_011583 [Mythimna separata]|uniref:Reverse transcriptase RNase H-like domain-containing protein n=1 Tax=Mythimna separata TaxID=271217 RepID=A0AAD7Y9L7_MYTSE|nr:hypothetical protein PYW07_011583 [Mythimna separata]
MKSSLTEIAQNDLKWWLNHLETPSPIHVPHPTHYIVTDASDDAWGAYINNTYISGTWKAEEKHLHCNQKEMLAILKTIHHYGQRLHKASLYIQCDSKTAVSYLRNEGGTKSIALMDLAHQILRFVDAYQMHFVIYHIPGVYNVEADRLSRVQRLPEWHLLPQVTNLVFAKWGRPVIDLFASRLAHVVPKYCTLDHQDQEAPNNLNSAWFYNDFNESNPKANRPLQLLVVVGGETENAIVCHKEGKRTRERDGMMASLSHIILGFKFSLCNDVERDEAERDEAERDEAARDEAERDKAERDEAERDEAERDEAR